MITRIVEDNVLEIELNTKNPDFPTIFVADDYYILESNNNNELIQWKSFGDAAPQLSFKGNYAISKDQKLDDVF